MSSALDFNIRWHVAYIPKVTGSFEGLPRVPRFDLFPRLFTHAILLAFICYASTYSVAKVYAQKNGYNIDANQELYAIGLSSMVSSFFGCIPPCGSFARTAVQDSTGQTQVSSLISSGFIVVVIFFLSNFLATLPRCTLSCIIIVALFSTFKKVTQLIDFWRISKLDGLLWVITFVLIILFGVDFGLLYSIIIGLVMLIFRLAM